MDGYEVVRRLKADNATAAIPVLFVTGNADPLEREKGLALGADDYVTKPFATRELVDKIRGLLG